MNRFARVASVVVLGAAVAVGVGVSSSTAAGPQFDTPLPQQEGAQGLAANAVNSFVVYGDSPSGHTVAVSSRTGRVAWRSATASNAALIAATPTIVWTASDRPGGLLVAQEVATGRTLRTFRAPGKSSWETLASHGNTLYAVRYTANEKQHFLATFQGDHRTHVVAANVPTACNSIASVNSVYLACFANVNAVYRVSPRTGAVLAKTVQEHLDGGQDFAYLPGSLYFVTSKHGNTRPFTLNRVDPKTLRLRARSSPQPIFAIAAASTHLLGLESDSNSEGDLLGFNPLTLKRISSTAILTQGYPFYLAATRKNAYVVQVTGYSRPGLPDETLIRIPLAHT